MKKPVKAFIAALLLLAISACEKKSCTNVVCASYQTCNDGQCICPNGYEGDTCSVLSSTKFTSGGGGWTVNEFCPDGPSGLNPYYSVQIQVPLNYPVNYIAITPLFGVATFYAEIINSSASTEGTGIYFPPQNQGGVQLSASYGTYYAPTTPGGKAEIMVTLNYTYQGVSNQCTETFRKQ